MACVNKVDSIKSCYKWEGQVVMDEPEILLIMKTSQSKETDLIKAVKEHHPYDCPEVIISTIDKGSEEYLNWVKEACK